MYLNEGRDSHSPSPDSTINNPLATGKKDVVEPGAPVEWGSLRYGVPKQEPQFGLPVQDNPPAAPEVTQFSK